MGSRTLPFECNHGTVVDWGDFGEHQNGCPPECFEDGARCPDQPECEQCEAEADAASKAAADRIEVNWTLFEDAVRGFLWQHRVAPETADRWTDALVAIAADHFPIYDPRRSERLSARELSDSASVAGAQDFREVEK